MREFRFCMIIMLIFLPGCLPANAQYLSGKLSDQARVSVLTVGPAAPLYTLFGHTAIRLNDPNRGIEVVYNYGTFDFNNGGFYLKFARGDMQYFLSRSSYETFLNQQKQLHRSVREQVLNLSSSQVRKIVKQLERERLPENRYYRYKFFANNCVTKVQDLLVKQKLVTTKQFGHSVKQPKTFRQMLQPYLAPRPWIRFGINLALGTASDRPATGWGRLFLPKPLYRSLAAAHLPFSEKSLVSSSQIIFESPPGLNDAGWLSPRVVFWIIFLVITGFTLNDWLTNRSSAWIDRPLFGAAGLLGIVLMLLSFGSLHEPLHHNWNLLWALPTHLIVAAGAGRRRNPAWFRYYLWAALILDIALLAGWFLIPQELPATGLPLILALMERLSLGLAGKGKLGLENQSAMEKFKRRTLINSNHQIS